MTLVLEVEEDGTLTLPRELLSHAAPHDRYVVEAQGQRFMLRPEPAKRSVPRRHNAKRELEFERWQKERQQLCDETLKQLGLRRIRLLSNNPDKVRQLERHGITTHAEEKRIGGGTVSPTARDTGEKRQRPDLSIATPTQRARDAEEKRQPGGGH